ncbi:hypothetical protein GALMADRAFT_252913 [Galerina marginata CBS 339.88]|uniref:DUF6533 domain-containing protein n=1 Tax=Galerina marginata (strain CBS 339.88) TaxID=685588 RepID=A0A067SRN0_GALM3|nr:hypothetical protein GALMADRAFT_252913 [Galerina marginata CBS 339.88]
MVVVDHDIPSTVREILIHNYLHMFAISCLYYDHFISSGQEIDYLWKRPKHRSSFWFFVNRYFAFFGNIAVTILGFSNLSVQSCKRYNIFRQLLLIINQVLVCILLTLRIYALYGCSLRVLAYLVGSGAAMIAIACWVMFGQKSAPSEEAAGCHIGLSTGTAIRLAGAWEALFVYDTIIFTLTVVKTWKARRDHAITGINIPLISLILRDGAIYFAVMAVCNLANILTFYFCGPFLRGSLSTFASSMAVTMMSRLMLNLHQTADLGIYSTEATSTNADYTSRYTDDTLDIVHPSAISDAESTTHRRRKSR